MLPADELTAARSRRQVHLPTLPISNFLAISTLSFGENSPLLESRHLGHYGGIVFGRICYIFKVLNLEVGEIEFGIIKRIIKILREKVPAPTLVQAAVTGLLDSFGQFLLRVGLYSNHQGAPTPLWASTSPETANLNGEVIPSIFFNYH